MTDAAADVRRRDPDAPLPGAPDPWAGSARPPLRDGPPWLMTEMIEAEPALAARLLGRLASRDSAAAQLAGLVRATASAGRPILVTGCGTSEHGAQATVAILRDALREASLPWRLGEAGAPTSVQAFEASLEVDLGGSGGLVIGISHEGGTWATTRALEAARAVGATVALVTVSDGSPGAALADVVVATEEQDQSWCHTVGYLSPILAATAVAGHLTGRHPDPASVRGLLGAGLQPHAVASTERLAGEIARAGSLVITATGADRPAARELALKVEEGTHLPATMRDLETVLHGHLAGMGGADGTGFVLILADPSRSTDRAARAGGVLRAVARLGIPAGGIVGAGYDAGIPRELTPAGRLVVPDADGLAPVAAALIGTAVPLQLLTERVARVRGVNPDPIRRDDPTYLEAAALVG